MVRSGEEETDGAPPAAKAMARRWSNSRSPPGWRRPTASPASATRDRFGWRGADAPPTATKAPPPTRGGAARTPPTKKTPGGPVPIRPNARVDTTDRRCGRSWRALRRRRPAMVITRTISLFSGRRPAAILEESRSQRLRRPSVCPLRSGRARGQRAYVTPRDRARRAVHFDTLDRWGAAQGRRHRADDTTTAGRVRPDSGHDDARFAVDGEYHHHVDRGRGTPRDRNGHHVRKIERVG